MGIFKKAEVKKTLTVLEAFQQAFGGVPDDAECIQCVENDFREGIIDLATILTPADDYLYWETDHWHPLNKFMFQRGKYYIITNEPAYKYYKKFRWAPQFNALLEKTEEGYANKDTYLNDLMSDEDY